MKISVTYEKSTYGNLDTHAKEYSVTARSQESAISANEVMVEIKYVDPVWANSQSQSQGKVHSASLQFSRDSARELAYALLVAAEARDASVAFRAFDPDVFLVKQAE